MRTEKDKMLSGELYNPSDVELINERTRTRLLLQELNDCKEDNYDERANFKTIGFFLLITFSFARQTRFDASNAAFS
jgi:hypothetical protein